MRRRDKGLVLIPCRQAIFQAVFELTRRDVGMKPQSPMKMPAFVSSDASSSPTRSCMPGRGTAGGLRKVCVPLRLQLALVVVSTLLAAAAPLADDWPEYRGSGRRGVWNETGILEKFPENGLKVVWRAPVKNGYAGPAVAGGRVFVSDFVRSAGSRGVERIMAFDEQTGNLLWKQEWEVNYGSTGFENGPHATPTVDGDRVYAVGGTGVLTALNAANGRILWRKDYVQDYGADLGSFGISSAPIVDGDRLIALVGGPPDAKVVAFDKK